MFHNKPLLWHLSSIGNCLPHFFSWPNKHFVKINCLLFSIPIQMPPWVVSHVFNSYKQQCFWCNWLEKGSVGGEEGALPINASIFTDYPCLKGFVQFSMSVSLSFSWQSSLSLQLNVCVHACIPELDRFTAYLCVF